MKRREPTQSEDLIDEASCSSTSPHDCEGRTKRQKGNDYEVFLSFRGEDTRKGFTDYLYRSLVDARIRVFRDDNELRVGEKIGPKLFHNIRQSTISIPIISENYASSKWCLRELALILKCKRNRGQIVLPIFYKVTPSQVGHLTGSFKDAIKAHKENKEEMVLKEWKKVLKEVKKWEKALKEVTSLKGWESEKIDNGHEGSLVKTIVTEVISKLKRNFQLHVPHQLVGIDNHIKDIMSFIDAKFNSMCIIGIYGIGGIGKTTLAKALYNKLSNRFEYCRFVADCRETSQRKGIKYLQKQLISGHVSNMDEGINLIKSQFAREKALILFDDINDSAHLIYLADRDWLKAGSIIIMTTRDKNVLKQVNANLMYPLNKLSWNQSMILFSRHAFRQDSPPIDFEDISRDIVSTTGGLPLALEVIGSFLFTKTKGTWKDMSWKLKKVPHKEVQDKLKISYDALDYEDQQIFLDIACFSNGLSKEYSAYMWESCKFLPSKGIEVLSLMSLIKIDEDGNLRMHDQLRDLGREIVRQENPKKPQERSRLWNFEEVIDVLDNNKATSNIEALSLGKNGKGITFTAKQFEKMTDLRFLQVDGANFIGDFQSLLPKLRWLQWQDCPSIFAATNFHLKKLVILDLSESAIMEDWEGWVQLKMATDLKVLNLSFCRKLKRTPDLSAFEKLEILDCAHCINLEEIHPSIGKLESLTELQLWDSRITKLPESIGNLQKLRNFYIGWTDETGITTLPESIGNLRNLETLRIGHIPVTNSQTGITTLPESIGNLQKLTALYIRNTPVTELPSAVGMLANLQVLDASRCRNLKGLPSSIGELVSLNQLDLHHTDIRGLPESISKLSSLQFLDVRYCRKLREIPELPSSLTALHTSFPTPSLPSLSKLTLLQELSLSDLRPLECLPKLPDRLSRVSLHTGWPMTDVDKEMELRFSELIRDKSSGLRKATKRQEDRFSIEFDIEEAFSSK